MKTKKIMEYIFIFVVTIAMVLVSTQHNNKKKQYYKELKQTGILTIGEVLDFSEGSIPIVTPKFASTGKAPYVKFKIIVDSVEKICKYDAWSGYIASKKIKKGEKFLVLVPKNLPLSESRMLFDYPIKDSADFKRYVKEFEEMRKRENNK